MKKNKSILVPLFYGLQVSKISGLNRVQNLLENLPQIHSVWIFTPDTAKREETSFPSLFLPSCSCQHWKEEALCSITMKLPPVKQKSQQGTKIEAFNVLSHESTREGGEFTENDRAEKNGLTSLKNQGVLLRGSLCLLDDEQPWHIQCWRWGIISWHGWVVEHEYILHRALFFLYFIFIFFVIFYFFWREGWTSNGWMLASGPEVADRLAQPQAAVGHSPPTRSSAGFCHRPGALGHPQPLWMYFLMTTQPCLKSGQGSDCRRVQVLVQGSKVSMFPRAGPSLLTMPPVA